MRLRKQSMREIRDAAEVERATGFVAGIGTLALEQASKRTKFPTVPAANVPGNKRQYFRGALVKPKQ